MSMLGLRLHSKIAIGRKPGFSSEMRITMQLKSPIASPQEVAEAVNNMIRGLSDLGRL